MNLKGFISKRFQLEQKAFLRIKHKVVNKANQLISGLTKAGYHKLTSKVIAIIAAMLISTPFSVTTILAGLNVIGAWGIIPGLGLVEGTFLYTFAIAIRKITKLVRIIM